MPFIRWKSQIDNIELSEDIISTCRAIEALGGEIQVLDSSFLGRKKLLVHGKGSVSIKNYKINCGESGTTARFVIPVSRLCEESAAIDGSGKLVSRPFNAFFLFLKSVVLNMKYIIINYH